jgi:hypothetical protein
MSPTSDPDDGPADMEPLHEWGPAPDLSHLDLADPLEGEWLLSDHPWARAERTRRRSAGLEASRAGDPLWALEADVDSAEPDEFYVAHMRRSLEAIRQASDRMYVYPPGLIGPMGSLWPPPGLPGKIAGCEAGGWNQDQ